MVREFLKRKEDFIDESKRLLFTAVLFGHLNIVRELLTWDKIDVNAKNELGRTVFDLARIHKKFDVAHYLEKRIEECSKNATMKTLRSCYRAASLVERWQIGRTHFLVILIDSMNS